MTDNEHIKPLDLSRYEGHTPGPWFAVEGDGYLAEWDECGIIENDDQHIAFTFSHDVPDARLIADAPLLLAEVKRLRVALGFAHAAMIREREKHTKPPTLLRDAINHARRVLGEEGGAR